MGWMGQGRSNLCPIFETHFLHLISQDDLVTKYNIFPLPPLPSNQTQTYGNNICIEINIHNFRFY